MIPPWSGAPSRTARRAARTWRGSANQLSNSFAHVGVVWGAARSLTGGEIEFAARLGQHYTACAECHEESATFLWQAVLPLLGVRDILRVITLEGNVHD